MSRNNQENRLVKRACTGDKIAFSQLIDKYHFRLLMGIKSILNDNNEVLDVLQETYLKAYKALRNFRHESSFYTWIYAIAQNTAKTHLRIVKKQSRLTIHEHDNSSALQNLSEQPEAMVFNQDLLETLNNLPQHWREIMILREIEGFSYAQIADVLAIPIGTVRSRLFRARRFLLDCYTP